MEQIIKLSVLICHLPQRARLLSRLVTTISSQSVDKPVELIVNDEDCSVGLKRNKLLNAARGEYVAFVDDDDEVPEYYVDEILQAATVHPDCIGIVGVIREQSGNNLFKHSIEYVGWYTGGDGTYYRTPNHLNPIKREIATAIRFDPSMSFGEDRKFSDRVRPHLKSEVYIRDKIMYYYNAGVA